MKIYFPEYMEAFGKLDGAFTLEILKKAPFPEDILELGAEGLKGIWHEAKLRGRGYIKADQNARYAENSVGMKYGADGGKKVVRYFAEQAVKLTARLDEIEEIFHQEYREIPYAENLLEIE